MWPATISISLDSPEELIQHVSWLRCSITLACCLQVTKISRALLGRLVDHCSCVQIRRNTKINQCFSQWQARKGGKSEKDRQKTLQLYEFMKAFRETFSRPVKRVRFIGLFDTVNSVPRFENAWMRRSGFPYTARTSAKVIRHAVSIDERRAKFRVDLISGKTLKELDEEDPLKKRKFHRYM
jgi:uncharacterized protein (DUF2235 family)